MKCPDCQSENPKSAKFCVECGNKLEMKCPKCGFGNSPSFKFCAECGYKLDHPYEPEPKDQSFDQKLEKIQRYLPKGLTEKILSQRNKIEGERKQVTVMFCDMEGFTALSEKLGPEEAYSIMDQVYRILIQNVHKFEGTVNEMTGDGILALFGAPIALEDAPQRAIQSAIAIHREMAKFSEKVFSINRSLVIKMRIGIHTGPVVVGTLGNDLRVEFKAVGDTVNLASRVEEIAEPGTTYVTKDTFTLTEGLFRFENLGDRAFKGKYKPIKIYRVLAPSTRRTRFDVSSELGLTPFTGRQRELGLLLDGLERTKEGRGQIFSIVAEAGLGKSRLLYEFRKAIATDNVTLLEGRCLSYSRNVAYHPVIDILRSNFRISESDEDFDIREKVKQGLKLLNVDEAVSLPYILDLLSVKDSGIDKLSISPEAKKARTLEALNQIVLKGSKRRPLIVAIEDLHWIDKSSEDSLSYLLDVISEARVLLIFTYRPEFIHTWGGSSYYSQLKLVRLSNRESLEMVIYLLDSQNIDANLEKLILDKAEWNPFFIEEFVRSLKDLGMIEKKDDTYHLKEDLKKLAIPSRIQDLIMARVDLLPENVKEVLQVGSVIGREFRQNLLKEVIEISEQDLLFHLSHLRNSELLYQRGIYPQSSYIFKHALTQESVYQSLLKSTRQRYHRIVAEILEDQFPEVTESQPEQLSRHFSAAGLAEMAVPYCQKAGEIAIRRSANVEAVEHLSEGLGLLKTLPENDERNLTELSLLITMGSPLIAIRGWGAPEVEKTYLRAKNLCMKIGKTSQQFSVLRGLWHHYIVKADYKTSAELSEQLMQIAQNLNEKTYLLGAHRARGSDLYWLGDFKNSKYHLEHVVSLYETRHHNLAHLWWTDPKIHGLGILSNVLWYLGYPNQALNKSIESLTLAHELSHSYSLVVALGFATYLFGFSLRNFSKAKELIETAIQICIEQKFPFLLANGNIYRSWVLGIGKNDETVIPKMRQSISATRATGTAGGLTYRLLALTEVYAHVGRLDEAMQTLEEVESFLNKTGERFREADLYRLKGEFLISKSTDRINDAETYFHKALTIARRQQAKSLELRAAMSMSRIWQSEGKIEEARGLLSEIYSWFTEGFDTADLIDAKALLEELS